MKLVEFRKKMRKQFYYKNFAWRMFIIATTAFFTWSAIYSQMNRIARKQFENVQLYNNGAVFVMDFLQYNNMIHNDMIKNGTIDKEAYNKFVAETFIEAHSADDYKIMPASVKGKSQELQESGYAMWASDKLNGELKSGRWFEGEANEAVVYGGKLKIGDTFSVEGRKFEVVGILSLPPISGWIHKDQSEYNVMDFCRIGITNFSKGVIINAKSEYARNNLADIYDVVFNIAKFSDEELKELETYGNVIYIDEFKGNTPWLIFVPIVVVIVFVLVLWHCMKMIREKVSKILGLYFSHGVSSDEGVKLFQKYSLKDVIIGTVVGLVAAYYGAKGCVEVIIFTVGVLVPMLIAVPVIKRFMKTEFYYCCPELDSKYQREMFILGEKTVNDNIALVFILKDNCAADRAYLKTSDYIKAFFLSAVKDTKASELTPFMRDRLEYAMRMARCEEKVVVMPNLWKEASEEEIANIKAIERKVEITFNRTIEWQEC